MEEREHTLVIRTPVLDQLAKAVMQSIAANTKRIARVPGNTKPGREMREEQELLEEGYDHIRRAQRETW